MRLPFQMVHEFAQQINMNGFGVHLNESQFSDLENPFDKQGLALSTYVGYVNRGIDLGFNMSNPDVTYNVLLQASVSVMEYILAVSRLFFGTPVSMNANSRFTLSRQNFNSLPQFGTVLDEQFVVFLDTDPMNFTVVNNGTYSDIVETVYKSYARPALWFYAAGV